MRPAPPRYTATPTLYLTISLTLLSGVAVPPFLVLAEDLDVPQLTSKLRSIAEAQARQLALASSDTEALSVYRDHLARSLTLEDTLPLLEPAASSRLRRVGPTPPDLRAPAVQLVKELTVWQGAESLRRAAERGDIAALGEVLDRERSRHAWLVGDQRGALGRALALAQTAAAIHADSIEPAQSPASFEAGAAHLDDAHPSVADGEDSWLALAERGEAALLRARLRAYWEQLGEPAEAVRAAAGRYYESRLRPVFLAQIAAWSIRAQAEAERAASDLWRRLRRWREDWHAAQGLARLCGTWVWTLHNHQNHQDHKMVVTFPPPGQGAGPEPQPARIVVLGDTVYLRWEFPGGYQEDSLLFSAKDQRLEGTFLSSGGPHGTITGRRAAPCGRGNE